MTRYSSDDLMKIDKVIGLGGRIITDGGDLTNTDKI